LDKVDVVEEKKKRERPEWYKKTVRRFHSYREDKIYLDILVARYEAQFPSNTAQISLSPGRSIGTTGDQTGSNAAKRIQIENEIVELRLKIKEFEIVFNTFGKEQQKLIKLRYFERYKKDKDLYYELHMPKSTYRRVRDLIIFDTAIMFGFCTRDQVSFEEMRSWWE
jgi:hypothetical protein